MIGCAVVYFFGLSFHFGVGFVFLPLMFCFVPFMRFVSCFVCIISRFPFVWCDLFVYFVIVFDLIGFSCFIYFFALFPFVVCSVGLVVFFIRLRSVRLRSGWALLCWFSLCSLLKFLLLAEPVFLAVLCFCVMPHVVVSFSVIPFFFEMSWLYCTYCVICFRSRFILLF